MTDPTPDALQAQIEFLQAQLGRLAHRVDELEKERATPPIVRHIETAGSR